MIIGHTLASADGRILAIDDTVADLLWRAPKDVIGMSYLDLTHESDRRRNQVQVGGLRQASGPLSIRKRYIRGDGGIVHVDLDVSRFTIGSDAGRLIGGFHLPATPAVDANPCRLWKTAKFFALFDRLRKERFGEDMFGDAIWSILLQFYLAEAEGRVTDEGLLCTATGLRPPMLQRWLAVLDERGLVDPVVHRCGSRQLTGEGILVIEALFAGLDEA